MSQPNIKPIIAWADRISFLSSMENGKGCDVWPELGDYVSKTGREVIQLQVVEKTEPWVEELALKLANAVLELNIAPPNPGKIHEARRIALELHYLIVNYQLP